MKKVINCFLMLLVIFCLPPVASSSCPDCVADYTIEHDAPTDALNAALETEPGENMIALVEELGGEVDLMEANHIVLPQAEAYQIPAGKRDDIRLDLLYLDLKNRGKFLLVIESSIDPFDFHNTHMKIYTPSGNVVLLEGFKIHIEKSSFSFQENDDLDNTISLKDYIKPSASSEFCLILLILCLVVDPTWLSCILLLLYCL